VRYVETGLQGAVLLEVETIEDERGGFARAYCSREMSERGLSDSIAQCNISMNHRQGTLRGMHYQAPPAVETKLVRCTRGAIWDVIVDMRHDSPTYLRHFAVELSADNHHALYVPEMFAHGFQTLVDDTEVFYMMGEFHSPGHARGLRHDDPVLEIEWPLPVSVISDRDLQWALLGAA